MEWTRKYTKTEIYEEKIHSFEARLGRSLFTETAKPAISCY